MATLGFAVIPENDCFNVHHLFEETQGDIVFIILSFRLPKIVGTLCTFYANIIMKLYRGFGLGLV